MIALDTGRVEIVKELIRAGRIDAMMVIIQNEIDSD
jgi:enterochelin esterase-like enzyme